MGFLHQGHLSLIKEAGLKSDVVVLSIFINPTQFGPKEDYKKYPRNLKRDLLLAKDSGVDIVFNPTVKEIYPANFQTSVNPGELAGILCGRSRPGHFSGVCTVVAKLLNIVEPDIIYLGQKDYQQALIIKKMIEDLDFFIKVKIMPIIREADGLAMSSRNKYLSTEDRDKAAVIFKALKAAESKFKTGCTKTASIKKVIKNLISSKKCVNIDYIEILDAETLKRVEYIKKKVVVAVAVKIKTTRLIDNIILKPQKDCHA
jgi:pantoate--beta-alanine ligase